MINEWDKLINRVRLEVTQRLGRHNGDVKERQVTAIRVVMLVDCNGVPIVWSVESTNIEPGQRARGLLELL